MPKLRLAPTATADIAGAYVADPCTAALVDHTSLRCRPPLWTFPARRPQRAHRPRTAAPRTLPRRARHPPASPRRQTMPRVHVSPTASANGIGGAVTDPTTPARRPRLSTPTAGYRLPTPGTPALRRPVS